MYVYVGVSMFGVKECGYFWFSNLLYKLISGFQYGDIDVVFVCVGGDFEIDIVVIYDD